MRRFPDRGAGGRRGVPRGGRPRVRQAGLFTASPASAGEPVREGAPEGALSVGELVERVRGALRGGLGPVCVVGEISGFKQVGGHCYFALKDDGNVVNCVLWRSTAARLRFEPRDGLEVLVFGRVDVYAARGALQLYVDRIEPHGLGALRQRLEALRARFEAEGVFSPERKRPLPTFPLCVGIVTTLRGAAVHDVLAILRERVPGLRIVIRPVRVQGIGASAEITEGIRDIQRVAELDVVIVGRGGGSIEDLWAFNEEDVVRAIVACRVPVVSGVGHEIDVTLADLAADHRAPTPTAAAEVIIRRRLELAGELRHAARALAAATATRIDTRRRRIGELRRRLRDPRREILAARLRARDLRARLARAGVRTVEQARETTLRLRSRLVVANPGRRVRSGRERLGAAARGLVTCGRHRLEVSRSRLRELGGGLSSLNPLAVLERGYSVVWKGDGPRAVRAAEELAVGDRVRLRFHRGAAGARIEGIDPEEET